MSSCSDIPCFGKIVDRVSGVLVKPGLHGLRYLLFYKGLVNDLELQVQKLKNQQKLMEGKAVIERVGRKIINDDVKLWQQDVQNIINDIEEFLKRYKEKGSRMRFKDIPFTNPVSLNRPHNLPDENIPILFTLYQKFGSGLEGCWNLPKASLSALHYLLCYNAIVNDLNSQIEEVKILDDRVAREVDEARKNAKIVAKHVLRWQEDAENIQSRADEISREIPSVTCFKVVRFPDPVSRFRLGREAVHLAKIVAELTLSGRELLADEVAYYLPLENVPLYDTRYHNLSSREEAYGKLWDALTKEHGHPIIDIYGMPGVGKTRMAEQAWVEAKEKMIFDKVSRANVGPGNIDVISLQNQLAGYLGCHLESVDNEVLRASQLKNHLINGGKTLIIFDDVWNAIPLKNIGVPFGDYSSNGSKILVTSRRQDVCLVNHCQDPIQIKTLTDSESWELFRNTVGISKIESLKDALLAEKICKECGALPLLIYTVGKTLRDASEKTWEEALHQLQAQQFEETDGIETNIHRAIQLSFDNLPNATMVCLLLCTLFQEDEDIDIKMLSDLAAGSQLLDKGRKINGLIDNLISSSLLLEGKDDRTVKMHDIIRDVARSTAERDPKYAFSYIRCSSWALDIADRTIKLLQLDLEGDNVLFPDNLVWPDLHTLWLQCNNHPQQHLHGFFKAFINLKLLVIKDMRFIEQQLSIHGLEKLRVLILDGCDVHQTFLNSVSRNLQTLCIRDCHLPNPLDLPELLNLKKLELFSETEIVILPNAISRVFSLEEVNIPGGFKVWEAAATSIVAELSKLTSLMSLMIHFDDSQSCPDEDIIPNLIEFNIHVGSKSYSSNPRYTPAGRYSRSITLEESYLNGGLMALVEKAEEVNLFRLEALGLSNGFSYNNKAFSNLKKLSIVMCNDVDHLRIFPEQHDIQQLPLSYSLSILEISGCRGLKFLLLVTVAKHLVQMKELRIDDCPMMEAIVKADGPTDGEIITFPKLKFLMLKDLPNLTSFYNDNPTTSSSSVEITEISSSSVSFFSEKVEFPALEKLVINNIGNEGELWANEVLKQKYAMITTSGTEPEGDTASE